MVRVSDSYPSIAPAAFHDEQIVTESLAEFVSPIANIRWSSGGMVIEFKPLANADWEAGHPIGPLGTARCLTTFGQ